MSTHAEGHRPNCQEVGGMVPCDCRSPSSGPEPRASSESPEPDNAYWAAIHKELFGGESPEAGEDADALRDLRELLGDEPLPSGCDVFCDDGENCTVIRRLALSLRESRADFERIFVALTATQKLLLEAREELAFIQKVRKMETDGLGKFRDWMSERFPLEAGRDCFDVAREFIEEREALRARAAAAEKERDEAHDFGNRWMKAAMYATPIEPALAFDPMNPEAFAESRRAALDNLIARSAQLEASAAEAQREIEALPHAASSCASLHKMPRALGGGHFACDCWKSAALAAYRASSSPEMPPQQEKP